MILQIGAGVVLSAVIGLIGYWRGSLSRSGILGAVLTGTLIFAFGGLVWGSLLASFFVSSSALSQYRTRAKALLADKFQKGSRRDLAQALANGGWAALLSAMFAVWHSPVLFAAFIGAMSTVTADTWATEIGVLSTQEPRLVSTGRPVPVGTSGGITTLGTLTALLGAAFIGGIAATMAASLASFSLPGPLGSPYLGLGSQWLVLIPLAAVSGLAGSMFDSFLGATIQAIYFCDLDHKETERRIHACGRKTSLVRGYPWIDNDVVNFLSSVLGSGVAALLWMLIFPGV